MSIKALIKNRQTLKTKMKDTLSKAETQTGGVLTEEQETQFQADKVALEKLNSQIDMIGSVDLSEDLDPTPLRATSAALGNSDSAAPAKKEFETCEEFMEAVLSGGNDQRLEYRKYSSEQRFDTGTKGGFMVPKQFQSQIWQMDPAAALVRPRATVIQAGNPPDAEFSFPALQQNVDEDGNPRVFGGVEVYKVAEGGTKPATDAELRMITLKPHEIAARIGFTDKLLRNWQAASGWATKLLQGAITSFEDIQFIRGNGVGGPKGILDSDSTIEVARTTSMLVIFADFQAMLSVFRGDLNNAVWVVSYSVFGQLLTMTGNGGGATNVISVNEKTGALSIYGIPVIRHPRMRTLGSKGDVLLSDFKGYVIKNGSGPIVEYGFATGDFEANKRSLKVTFNVDGKSWLSAPFTDEDGFESSYAVVLGLPSGS